MTDPIRLAVISTSRSDFGLLEPVVHHAIARPRFQTHLFICGQHIAAETPLPHETAGLPFTRTNPPAGTIDLVAQQWLCDALSEFRADIALVLGDRFELLSVAECCTFAKIPLAHCSGGERTLGAFDDQIRDAVTKLAHLHFVSHEPAAERVRLLLEEPWRIAVTGDPGLDSLLGELRTPPEELESLVGAAPSRGDVVIALHPVTRSASETRFFLDALTAFCVKFPGQVFLSAPNGDPGSDAIAERWAALARERTNCHCFSSLGARGFRSLVAASGALAGNSSSGVWEAPSLATPSLDLGTRQLGRVRGDSVLHCGMEDPAAVGNAILKLLSPEYQARMKIAANPYGDGRASERILNHIEACIDNPGLMVKA